MFELNKELKNNPLNTKQDIAKALLTMCRPLKEYYSPGKAYLYLGNTGVHYGDKCGGMEGFTRVLWGIGPLLSASSGEYTGDIEEEIHEWYELCKTGILNGTNPMHKEYWGSLRDYDQMMVEMASIVTAISLNKDKLWDNFDKKEKDNLYNWLNQINSKNIHPNNWRFFRILVNMTFILLDLPFSREHLDGDLLTMENCYTGDGWYYDGNPGQVDYYIPFAMHYYGLLYAGLMEKKDSQRSEQFISRGMKFLEDYLYMFSRDGSEIPYGRSLTYRFAHSAYFAALSFSSNESLPWGVIKGTYLNNLRHWFSKPILDASGFLTIGYEYPNLYMSENYNSPTSPYWAFKAFLMLAVDKEHPIWCSKEEEYEYEELKCLKHPHMLIAHDKKSGHVQGFTTGQHCPNHGNSAAKYEKFVYSNKFGFSVMRGNSLNDGAFDNTLAVSLSGDNFYRMRYGVKEFEVTDTYLSMKYEISSKVQIESLIVPLDSWHVRIHKINTEEDIDIADGGFAIKTRMDVDLTFETENLPDKEEILQEDNSLFVSYPYGVSGVFGDTVGDLELIRTFPNTNLMSNLTVIPTFKKNLTKGEHLIITAFYGNPLPLDKEEVINKPEIYVLKDTIVITSNGREIKLPNR